MTRRTLLWGLPLLPLAGVGALLSSSPKVAIPVSEHGEVITVEYWNSLVRAVNHANGLETPPFRPNL